MKSTPQKKNANRANAKKSTGPKSELGKRRSAKNGLTHGLRSLTPVIPGIESEKDWIDHKDAIVDQLQPNGAIEAALAERIALGFWRLARCSSAEGSMLETIRERRRNRALSAELTYKEREKQPSDQAAFEAIRHLAEESEEIAKVWRSVRDGTSKRTKIDSEIANAILHQAVESWQWDQIKEPFSEAFSWPPKSNGDFQTMLSWLAHSCTRDGDHLLFKKAEEAEQLAHFYSERVRCIEDKMDASADLILLSSSLTETIPRYETTIHRALLRDLHELQRIQAMRLGVTEAVPTAVDITEG